MTYILNPDFLGSQLQVETEDNRYLLGNYETEFTEDIGNLYDSSCITPGNPYILHCFPAHKTELTVLHHQHLDIIAKKIIRSFRGSRPITRIIITGHAATWKGISKAKYARKALARAENALNQLRDRLTNVGLVSKVKLTIKQRADDKPLVDNMVKSSSQKARDNRAQNRRVEINFYKSTLPPKPKPPKPTPKPKPPKPKPPSTIPSIEDCKNPEEVERFWREAVKRLAVALKRLNNLASMPEANRKKEWRKGQELIWFGNYSFFAFKIIRWRLKKINAVLTHSKLKLSCNYSLEELWGRASRLAKKIELGKVWLNSTKNNLERTQTFIHEAAHIAGVINVRESKKYGELNAKKLAQKSPLKARRNADNYGYYVMYIK